MQEPAEETPHLNPIKGSRILITEQKTAEWLRVGKGGDIITLMVWAELEISAWDSQKVQASLQMGASPPKFTVATNQLAMLVRPALLERLLQPVPITAAFVSCGIKSNRCG